MSLFDLSGKLATVTGATRDISRAIAAWMAEADTVPGRWGRINVTVPNTPSNPLRQTTSGSLARAARAFAKGQIVVGGGDMVLGP